MLDDLAIQRAKEQLASLSSRPGYETAMHPVPFDAPGLRRAMVVMTVVCAVLAVICAIYGGALWLRILLTLVLTILAGFAGLAMFGSRRDEPPMAWPVAVLAKAVDDSRPEHPDHQLTLLREDGSIEQVSALESVYAAARAGDVGVAHVRTAAFAKLVTELHRL